MYPRLPVRIIADSLYPSIKLIELCEKEKMEYIFVLKDKRIPSILEEFLAIVSMPEGNRELKEDEEKITLTLWENEIDYREKKGLICKTQYLTLLKELKKVKK